MESCLLLYMWQLSFFSHTAWQSGKPLIRLDSKAFCYNNTTPIQPIRAAKEWFLSLLIWIVAIAGAPLMQPPFMVFAVCVFCWISDKTNLSFSVWQTGAPAGPLDGGVCVCVQKAGLIPGPGAEPSTPLIDEDGWRHNTSGVRFIINCTNKGDLGFSGRVHHLAIKGSGSCSPVNVSLSKILTPNSSWYPSHWYVNIWA